MHASSCIILLEPLPDCMHFYRASGTNSFAGSLDSTGFRAATTGCQSISRVISEIRLQLAIMANRDANARTQNPDPPDVTLMDIVILCQNQLARCTMHSADYNRYMEIQDDFLNFRITYAEFRRRMGVLLDVRTAPHYQHLHIFLDVYHRAYLGQELLLDNVLCLFPLVLSSTLDLFIHSVRTEGTLRNWVREPDPVRRSRLVYQRASEASRFRNRRYNMASRDSIRDPDPDLNPGVLLLCLLNWCQEQAARVIMQPPDYQAYLSWTWKLRNGTISYDVFRFHIRAVLRNPRYNVLRVWWNVHKYEVYGVMQMLDNPMVRYPLALFITLSMVLYFALLGSSLWDTCLENARSRSRGDDV